jgi:hypothetical protein
VFDISKFVVVVGARFVNLERRMRCYSFEILYSSGVGRGRNRRSNETYPFKSIEFSQSFGLLGLPSNRYPYAKKVALTAET